MEKRINEMGKNKYMIEGDNVRKGIKRDIGF